MDDPEKKLFQEQMLQIKRNQLTNMLRCKICNGLFRFAHTVVECGHTFCHICILNCIKGYRGKNPTAKCPQCHNLIDGNYKKSIIKDVFKQSLVDMLAPEFAQKDQIIIERVQALFPEFDLQYLIDEFKYSNFEVPVQKGRKKQSNGMGNRLSEKIKEKLGLNFEEFVIKVGEKESFDELDRIMKQKNSQLPKTIKIKPKTQRDEQYVGINSQIKVNESNLIKLQKFLEKQALNRISETEDIPPEWLNNADEKLCIKIYLFIGTRLVLMEENLQQVIKENRGCSIYYSLSL